MAQQRFHSVLLFGAPGVGKGTQGRILGQIPGFFHLSCGDVFRSLDIGSTEGREIYKYSSKGMLVPDEITIKVWKRHLDALTVLSHYKPHEDLLILDGIPRNRQQAELVESHIEVLKIVHLKCSDTEAMIHRIRRRAHSREPRRRCPGRNHPQAVRGLPAGNEAGPRLLPEPSWSPKSTRSDPRPKCCCKPSMSSCRSRTPTSGTKICERRGIPWEKACRAIAHHNPKR